MNYTKKAAEVRAFAVSFDDKLIVTPAVTPPLSGWWPNLPTSELLTGTPTVVEVGTAALTIANVALNAVVWRIGGQMVPISKAVQFTVAGGISRSAYTLRVTASTDGSPAQTLVQDVRLVIE